MWYTVLLNLGYREGSVNVICAFDYLSLRKQPFKCSWQYVHICHHCVILYSLVSTTAAQQWRNCNTNSYVYIPINHCQGRVLQNDCDYAYVARDYHAGKDVTYLCMIACTLETLCSVIVNVTAYAFVTSLKFLLLPSFHVTINIFGHILT